MQTKTIKEAIEQGYKMFFVKDSTMEQCYPIEDASDYLDDGDELILAKESDSINLDAYWIIESACEELFEDAAERVYGTSEYEKLKKACEDINKNLKEDTTSYIETDFQLVK